MSIELNSALNGLGYPIAANIATKSDLDAIVLDSGNITPEQAFTIDKLVAIKDNNSKQMFNYETRTLNTYVNTSGGVVYHSSLSTSGFIKVSGNTEYYCSALGGAIQSFSYDSSFNVIGTGNTSKTFTTPSTACYINFTLSDSKTVLCLASKGIDYAFYGEKLKDTFDISSNIGDNTNSCNYSNGMWGSFHSGLVSFNIDHLEITTGNESFSGGELKKELSIGKIYYAEFEAKISSGNVRDWYLTNGNNGTSAQLLKLTTEYQKFLIPIILTTLALNNFVFYQNLIEVGNVLSVKNFWYYEENNLPKYCAIDRNKIRESLKLKISLSDKKNSLDSKFISNDISDLLRPDRKGKIELRDSDIVPSVNTMGQGYLFNNSGTIELRVVKNSSEIVGVALSSKKISDITTKTISIAYFGDSITFGTGSTTSYPVQTNTLLQQDGHTISAYTNIGVSGYTASQLSNYVSTLVPVPHSNAVLMIGINDIDQWLGYYYANSFTNIQSSNFRDWYKSSLSTLIKNIKTYCSYSKLFLVVPTPQRVVGTNYPTERRVSAEPLMDIVIQECIDYYNNNTNTVHLCRGDYYLKNPTSLTIADGVHPTTLGASMLAQGVRNELTYRLA